MWALSKYNLHHGWDTWAWKTTRFGSYQQHAAQTKPQSFCRIWPVSVARSSSGGVAKCHVLPVLWMTLHAHNQRLFGLVWRHATAIASDLTKGGGRGGNSPRAQQAWGRKTAWPTYFVTNKRKSEYEPTAADHNKRLIFMLANLFPH